jgi:hypothetical protein
MNRWKQELNDWAVERGFHAVYVPRDISHDSWKAAKAMMAITDEIMREPGMQARIDDALTNLVLFGSASLQLGA